MTSQAFAVIEEKPRQRKHHSKTRNGCQTCKKRKVKCDERKPVCQVCENGRVKCDGYQIPQAWIFESRSSKSRSNSDDNISIRETSSPEDHGFQMMSFHGPRILERALYVYPLRPPLSNADAEASTLMKSYADMAHVCPMAWEGEMFRPQGLGKAPFFDESPILASTLGALTPPLRNRGYLALAAAALHLFEPQIFSSQLHFKYLQMAVAEIRTRIAQQSFVVDDLLHGISKVFLATVLHGDEASARAHLIAANKLINQSGGLDSIDHTIAGTLRYGDLHLAVETMSAPVFPLILSVSARVTRKESPSDPVLLHWSLVLKESIDSSMLPPVLILAVRHFITGVTGLVRLWKLSYPNRISIAGLSEIAPSIARALTFALSSRTQCTGHTQAGCSIALVLWVQLLTCFANEDFSEVSIQGNILPVLSNKSGPSAVAVRQSLSENARQGLESWNRLVFEARIQQVARKANDWLELVGVVTEMEKNEDVQIYPLMHRLLALRKGRFGKSLTKTAMEYD